MKYKSINELFTFNSHDAIIENMEYKDNLMKWHLSDVNIQTDNSQNTYSTDMCANDFLITFENVIFLDMYFISPGKYDDKGNIVQVEPNMQVDVANMIDTLMDFTKEKPCVLGHCSIDEGVCFTIHSNSDVLEFVFCFTKCIAEWDEFYGKSWYVK